VTLDAVLLDDRPLLLFGMGLEPNVGAAAGCGDES
jgi:hypothetical protein